MQNLKRATKNLFTKQKQNHRKLTHGMGVGGCWGRTKQTEMWSARLESRPVGAAAAGCVG